VTPEEWQRVKQVLAAALGRPPGERQAYLDRACTEPTLRRELESLIAAHEQSGSGFTISTPNARKECAAPALAFVAATSLSFSFD
jgi:hypothetical protein